MKETEFHNLFKVAESRNIAPQKVTEYLISNGCHIYIDFFEEHFGTMVFEGLKKVEVPTTFRIESGKVYPITPDSRIELVSALSDKKYNEELKIRINWEENEAKHSGYFIIKVKVNLMLNLVIDYEDSRFLPPLSNIDGGLTVTGISSPSNFFSDKNFHQLVLRTMRKEGKNWNIVKRNLSKHTLEGEKIKIIEVSNHEGEMRPQIQFSTVDSVEPYKVMESTFKKKLTAYRKHLK